MEIWDPGRPFTWRDGERLVRFGCGVSQDVLDHVDGPFALLTTSRGADTVPTLARAAEAVHLVPGGLVDRLAALLRPDVRGGVLVAVGGGRVIDVAKALASADPPRRVVAVPTTLSGAEMTSIHRLAAGAPPGRPRVRPAMVCTDPGLLEAMPRRALVASAMNALGHAVEAPLTPRANPLAAAAAAEAVRHLDAGLDGDVEALALGGMLAGYAIGSAGYGLHHVLAQTLAREAGPGHGSANAVMLPHSLGALAARMGAERVDPGGVAGRLAARGAAEAGAARLRDLGVARDRIPDLARAAAERAELAETPPAAGREELAALYAAAW